jgi:tRNA pseudouridine(38-40) synthase
MQRYLAWVQYRGGAFHGWQAQQEAGCSTVQGALEAVLSAVFGEGNTSRAVGSSRTDAGVHAACNVVHFDAIRRHRRTGDALPLIPPRGLVEAANAQARRIAPDLRVLEAVPVPSNVSARFDALGKTYLYRFLVPSRPLARPQLSMPLHSVETAWALPGPVDVGSMQLAASAMVGDRDFSCVRVAGCSSKTVTRHVFGCTVRAGAPSFGGDILGAWHGDWGMACMGGSPEETAPCVSHLTVQSPLMPVDTEALMRKSQTLLRQSHIVSWDDELLLAKALCRAAVRAAELDRSGPASDPLHASLTNDYSPRNDWYQVHQRWEGGGKAFPPLSASGVVTWAPVDLVVSGNAFLYKQVRSMASLIASAGLVGAGTWERDLSRGRVGWSDVAAMMGHIPSSTGRVHIQPAPPHGLTLRRVHMPPLASLCTDAEQDLPVLKSPRGEFPGLTGDNVQYDAVDQVRASECARRVRRMLWGGDTAPRIADAILSTTTLAELPARLAEALGSPGTSLQTAVIAYISRLHRRVQHEPIPTRGMPVQLVLRHDGIL